MQSLGWYTDVLTYDDVASLPEVDAVSVDISGDGPTLAAVHERLGDHLKYSMIIGKSHHDSPFAEVASGPTPELFFAPTEVSRRIEEWGAEEYQRRCAEALEQFVDGSHRWLTVERTSGPAAAASTWSDGVRRSGPAERRPGRLPARLTSEEPPRPTASEAAGVGARGGSRRRSSSSAKPASIIAVVASSYCAK